MYIYHALINALSAHMIHINLNMIFYTHVEHSPTKTIYIKYYKTKTNKKRSTDTHPQHSVLFSLLIIIIIIIIMYIYHALINALSAHMIHINLNTIFYTHVEDSPTTKT